MKKAVEPDPRLPPWNDHVDETPVDWMTLTSEARYRAIKSPYIPLQQRLMQLLHHGVSEIRAAVIAPDHVVSHAGMEETISQYMQERNKNQLRLTKLETVVADQVQTIDQQAAFIQELRLEMHTIRDLNCNTPWAR